jgi:hypothetical protein
MREQLKDRTTSITIMCQDGSKRIVKAQGAWSHPEAKKLGIALENENFLSVSL